MTYSNSFKILRIIIDDNNEADILSIIPVTNLFISLAILGGNVLVHCRRSQSRSPAVIIAYMISQLHYTYDQAVNVVKGAHFCVNLNPGFEKQLQEYALANGNEFRAEELYRSKHFKSFVTQFSEGLYLPIFLKVENEAVENLVSICHPQIWYFSPSRTKTWIELMSPFVHQFRCKKCNTVLTTRNRFCVHGWDHSRDFDLSAKVSSILKESDESVDFREVEEALPEEMSDTLSNLMNCINDILQVPISDKKRQQIQLVLHQYMSLCKEWGEFRGIEKRCNCCADCCSWIRKQLHHTPGYLKCPGNCDSIVGSFLLEPFSCSCGEQLVAKVIFDWNAFL